MAVNELNYKTINEKLRAENVKLVAVSKLQSVVDISAMYQMGQRDFGENYVQELLEKQKLLPGDIHWHFIGHLQKNKVKYIAPFVRLIHGVDSLELLREINKQASKCDKVIDCLLQIHIAQEETKFGMDEVELDVALKKIYNNPAEFSNVNVTGLMGMASFSDDAKMVRREMNFLKQLFEKHKHINSSNIHVSILSMGMSGDYKMAIEEGSNMVRIGSLLFGARTSK